MADDIKLEDEQELVLYQRTLAILISIATCALAIFVITGWLLGSSSLVAAYPGLPAMSFNTAILVLLTSFALGCVVYQRKILGSLLCIAIFVISGAFLLQMIFGLDLGINTVLYDPKKHFGNRYTNQASIYSACCFFLLSLGLASILFKNRVLPHVWLPGLLATVMIIICVVGLYGTNLSYTSQYLYVSAYTLIGILLLIIGMLLAATSWVHQSYAKGVQIWVSILIALGIMTIVAVFYIMFTYQTKQTDLRELRYDSRNIFEFVATRMTEVVNTMERSSNRFRLAGPSFDTLWESDGKNFLETLTGFKSMFVVQDNEKILNEISQPDFHSLHYTPELLPLLKNGPTYQTFRTQKGVQLLAIQYPFDAHRKFVSLFQVSDLIKVPNQTATNVKFDLLIFFGDLWLCNTFLYSLYNEKRDYTPYIYERIIGGQPFKAYMWPRPTSGFNFREMLPVILLVTGALLANFVGFLFYLIQKFKGLGEQLHIANNAKTMFLANVSHEVRTPLHGIIGTVSLMKNLEMPPKQSRYVHIINSSAHHLLNLINNLLDLTKIEANSYSFLNQPCNVKQTASETLQFLSIKAQEKKIEVILNFSQDPTIKTVKIPIQAFTQVLINIVGNAIKFTDKGKVTLSIFVKDAPSGPYMDIVVNDTGTGVPKEKQHLIFQKFSQVDQKASIVRGGTGLGLFLTKVLVEQLKGNIRFESTPGVGSTFYIHLPVEKVDGTEKSNTV